MNKTNYIYGIRPIIEAIHAGKEVDKILLQKGLKGELIWELARNARERGIPLQYVPAERLKRITTGSHQGAIAFISPIDFQPIDTLIPSLYETGKDPFILILDSITDVRNFGAIARTAECAGVDVIIIPAVGSAAINADAVKTSAGALTRLAVHRSFNLKDTVKFLKQSGIQIIACTGKTENMFTAINYTVPTAIIMGAEDTGISGDLLKMSDELIKIPLFGKISSLNVSVAAGIVMYEAVKQRIFIK